MELYELSKVVAIAVRGRARESSMEAQRPCQKSKELERFESATWFVSRMLRCSACRSMKRHLERDEEREGDFHCTLFSPRVL